MSNPTPPPAAPTKEETLADCVRKISKGFDSLAKSGLNQRAIVVLLKAHTKVCQRDIRGVLTGLRDLEKAYCK